MRRREPTPRERFDNLSLEYGSKVALARSIASATGRSEKTVLRHFKEGTFSKQELQLLKRREKYSYVERPRLIAKSNQERLSRGEEITTIGGRKVATRYNPEDERFTGKGAINSTSLLEVNGLDSVFVSDFARDIVHGEFMGLDLNRDAGREIVLNFRIVTMVDNKPVVDNRTFITKISNELPSDVFELFRKIYRDGTGASVELI